MPTAASPWSSRSCGRASALERTAHSFLGSCANLGATYMSELCARLEKMGRAGSTSGAREIIAILEQEYVVVQEALLAEKRRLTTTGERPAAS